MLSFDEQAGNPKGVLRYDVFHKGQKIESAEERNLIVDLSKQIHARLLGGDVVNRSVTQFAVGTNGSAPVAGNTTLTGQFAKRVDAVAYPESNQVQFAFSLASGEANGVAIMEFGLLTAGGVLYARRIRATALNKDTDISLSGTWTISF
jgi:hypothetical protein